MISVLLTILPACHCVVAVVVAVIIVFGFSQFIVFGFSQFMVFGFSQFMVFGFSLFIPIAYAGVLAIVANVMPTIDNKAFVVILNKVVGAVRT